MNILYSGGAKGADTIFAMCAQHRGDKVYAFSFPGHKVEIGKYELNEGQLEGQLDTILIAAKGLKRQISKTPTKHPGFRFIRNLILRNAWQIHGLKEHGPTTVVYAVAPLNKFHTQVEGGTAWAVEIAVRQTEVPVYVFDLKTNKWYLWVEDKFHVQKGTPPTPTGVYTGIGSRDMTDEGIEAIGNLFNLPISPLEDPK